MLTAELAAQSPPATVPDAQVIELADLMPPAREMLDQAARFLQSGNPSRALLLLEDLLRIYPLSPQTEEALYLSALAYRELGRVDEARQMLRLRAERFPGGPRESAARLLAGELLASDGKWSEARTHLQAATRASEATIRHRAHYLLILAALQLKDLSSARPSMEALVRDQGTHPYADFARLQLGILAARENRPQEATAAFRAVLSQSNDPALRAEAAVRAGQLAQSRQQWAEAIANYEAARRTGSPEDWKALAHLGLVQSHFAAGDYSRVLDIVREVRPAFPPSARSQVFFLAAEAARLAGRWSEALENYNFFLKEFPDDPRTEDALWGRVLTRRAQAQSDPTARQSLAAEAARFLARYPKSSRRFQAGLLRAEALDDLGEHKISAPMLAALTADTDGMSTLSPEAQAALLYRAARAAYAAQTPQATRPLLARLLAEHPQSPLYADALWLDGAAALATKNQAEAFAAWNHLLLKYPTDPRRESLIWQTALLAHALEQPADVVRLLTLYLKDFPQTSRTAEAHYLLALATAKKGDEQASRPHWEIARTLDPRAYYGPATQQLIRLALQRQDTTALRTLVDEYDAWRRKNPKAPPVALEVYEWLGQQLADSSDPAPAEPYLRLVLAASKDRAQRQRVQLRLAQLLSQLHNHGAAIREWSAYRVNFPQDANRSAVLEPLARAFLGAGQLDEATRLAEQILAQNPEGEFNARGRILLGDIALARGQPVEAARIFSTTALLMDDPVLTPQALSRAEQAYRRSGQTKEADAALLELKKRFPSYRE